MLKPILNLNRLPTANDAHLWADYIELICLANLDGETSKADILDRLGEGTDLGERIEHNVEENSHPSIINDKRTLEVDDWFRHLEYRQGIFQEFYPFLLSQDGNVLLRNPSFTVEQKLYIFLLIASNLRCINKSNEHKITSSFEFVSSYALKTYLPGHAQVHVFGKNPLNTSGRYSSGKLWDRICKLAEDICETVYINENEFKPNDTGDNGLDIVGWIPLNDKARGFLVILGQCACTLDWVSKQFSSSHAAWSDVIRFKVPTNNMTFIPFCFRSSDGDWYRHIDIKESILVDRVRFIGLLRNTLNGDLLSQIPLSFIDEAIQYREEIF